VGPSVDRDHKKKKKTPLLHVKILRRKLQGGGSGGANKVKQGGGNREIYISYIIISGSGTEGQRDRGRFGRGEVSGDGRNEINRNKRHVGIFKGEGRERKKVQKGQE